MPVTPYWIVAGCIGTASNERGGMSRVFHVLNGARWKNGSAASAICRKLEPASVPSVWNPGTGSRSVL